MIRNIISKLIIILIILFAALSSFWFFKTSAVKKQITKFISDHKDVVSASSISVTGFPIEQKLVINDLKIQISALNPVSSIANIFSNTSEVNLKRIEALSSIFNNKFSVNSLEEVSLQDFEGISSFVEFNQSPQINFAINDGSLFKVSYQDSGYKITDAGKNVLFENGPSVVNFLTSSEEKTYRHKIKADFKDINALSFSNDIGRFGGNNINQVTALEIPSTPSSDTIYQNIAIEEQNPEIAIKTTEENIQKPENAIESLNSEIKNMATAEEIVITENSKAIPEAITENQDIEISRQLPSPVPSILVKKSLLLDLEYITSKKDVEISFPSVIPVDMENYDETKNIKEPKKIYHLIINNLEISSPLYKININGDVNFGSGNLIPLGEISVHIEKLENILTMIKKSMMGFPNNVIARENYSEETYDGESDNKIISTSKNPTDNLNDSNFNSANLNSANIIDQKPIVDVAKVVRDLAKENLASSEKIAVFDFKQEENKELSINETVLSEIIKQMITKDIPRFTSNPENLSKEILEKTTKEETKTDNQKENKGEIQEEPSEIPQIIEIPNVQEIPKNIKKITSDLNSRTAPPIPSPAKIGIPAKPENYNSVIPSSAIIYPEIPDQIAPNMEDSSAIISAPEVSNPTISNQINAN
ncbi:MAG: hypothetical protein ACI9TO_000819 [Rickettsiales bacterium]|jgi:hypothetical protein